MMEDVIIEIREYERRGVIRVYNLFYNLEFKLQRRI